MLIESLSFKNFRQYKDATTIEFAKDSYKNITVILGNNTFGKTTLLQMFNWCFYDKANLQDPDMLLNIDVALSMFDGDSEEVLVEIKVLQNNNSYTITRKQKYYKVNGNIRSDKSQLKIARKDGSGKTDFIGEGDYLENQSEKEKNAAINGILPEGLSDYFFFDTERVNNVSTKKDISKAVKGLLGLDAYDNAIKHLGGKGASGSVIGKFYKSLGEDSNVEASEAMKQLNEAEERLLIINDDLNAIQQEIEHFNNRRDELETELRAVAATKALQEKIDDYDKNISDEQYNLKKVQKEIFEMFGGERSRSKYFYAIPLMKKALAYLEKADVDDRGIYGVNAQTINELIARGRCICGTIIADKNEAFKHLKEELKFVPPESLGTTIKNFKKSLTVFNKMSNGYYEDLKAKMESQKRSYERIDHWEEEIDATKAKISSTDYAYIEEEKNVVLSNLQDETEKKEEKLREKVATEESIKKFRGIYEKLTSSSMKNKEISQYLMYAENLCDWIGVYCKEKEAEIREQLEEAVNNIFSEMYSGERTVHIDDKFRVSLITNVNGKAQKTGESEGLIRVKNFAFIGGLVYLAKSKIKVKSEFDISSEPYPLVLDAPFSNADENHVISISKKLPEVAEQVIMFVMEKDWKYAKPVVLDKVGKQYILNKHSEYYSTID